MDLYNFYIVQREIDNFKMSNFLKEIIQSMALKQDDFLFYKKLDLVTKLIFSKILRLRVTKKLALSYLEKVKLSAVCIYEPFKLPKKYLIKIMEFIDDHKEIMTDEEYKQSLDLLMGLY